MTQQQIVEITEFTHVDGTDDATLLEASAGIQADLESFPGFVRRDLLRGEDGTWVDLVWWESKDAAESAVETAMTLEAFGRYFSLIDESSIEMHHFETVQTHATR